MARNGIVWYMENTDEANECDNEALQTIDAALNATDADVEQYEKRIMAQALREAMKYFEGRSDYAVRELALLAYELEGE